MANQKSADITIECPCCSAKLTIDPRLRKVIAYEVPPKHTDAPDLGRAAQLLQEQAARREAIFRQSAEEQKIKSQLLERKFEEAMKKSKGEPVSKPTRDIDL